METVSTFQEIKDILARDGLYLAIVTCPNPATKGVAIVSKSPDGNPQKAVRVIGWLENLGQGGVYNDGPVNPLVNNEWGKDENGKLQRLIPVSEVEAIVQQALSIFST